MKIAIVTGASSGMGREFAKQITHFYKNLDEIYEHLGFDVYHPEIVACKFRNDANLIGALYQHIQTFK